MINGVLYFQTKHQNLVAWLCKNGSWVVWLGMGSNQTKLAGESLCLNLWGRLMLLEMILWTNSPWKAALEIKTRTRTHECMQLYVYLSLCIWKRQKNTLKHRNSKNIKHISNTCTISVIFRQMDANGISKNSTCQLPRLLPCFNLQFQGIQARKITCQAVNVKPKQTNCGALSHS